LEGQESIPVVLLVAIGTVAMLMLVVSIMMFVALYQRKVLAQKNEIQAAENRHQKELLNASMEIAEQEREKIAKNIHDDVGTLLNVIRLQMTKLSRNATDVSKTEELVKESLTMVDESIQTVRGIAHDLMPPTLVKLGFDKGVAELCRQINASGQVKVEATVDTKDRRLPARSELQLYRAVREVINNILKHSKASALNVAVRATNESLSVLIHHNGIGISNEAATQLAQSDKGVGLKSIQSRVQLVNGTIQYLTKGQSDSDILIEVPAAWQSST
jgi:signal transduction histidine kinase